MNIKYAGIDVSSYQGNIDFDAVKAGKLKDIPVSFVIIRISAGKYPDTRAIANIKQALESGLDVGVYHYSTARTADDAKAEAELVLKLIKDNGFDGKLSLPVTFDIEENDVLKLGKAACTEIAKAFMDTIAAANYQPMLYTYAAAYNAYFDKNALQDYPLWVAAYISEKTLNNTYGIKNYAVWQFGVAGNPDFDLEVIGSVAGVKGQCDVDYMYEDLAAKIKAEGKNVFPKENGTSYTLTITDIPTEALANELLSYAEGLGYSGTVTENKAVLSVGDRVMMEEGAPIYGTTDKFAGWVYKTPLYVREINGDRIVVSTRTSGDVTGAVDRRYLIRL